MESVQEEIPKVTVNLARIARSATILAFVIVCGAFAVDSTLEGFSSLFIQQLPFQGVAQSAWGLMALYLASATGRSLTSLVINRLGDWRTLLGGLGVAVAGVLALIIGGSVWGPTIGMLLTGMGFAPVAPIAYSVMGNSHQSRRERATSRLTAGGYCSFIVSPIVVGAVGNRSLYDAFRLLPLLLVVMIGMTCWFGYRQRSLSR